MVGFEPVLVEDGMVRVEHANHYTNDGVKTASFVFVKKPFNSVLGKSRYVRSKIWVIQMVGSIILNGHHFPRLRVPTANFVGQGRRKSK